MAAKLCNARSPRFARVHHAILLNPLRLNAIRQTAPSGTRSFGRCSVSSRVNQPVEGVAMRFLSPRGIVAGSALAALACARNPQLQAEPSPEYVAVRSCATNVAVGEGFQVVDRPGTAWIASSSLPGDSVSWVESLVLRVRVYSDSVLPQATVRRAQFNHPRKYPVSSTGRRIQDRVNQECRIARTLDRVPHSRAVDLPY
jgi:hypothetical protein